MNPTDKEFKYLLTVTTQSHASSGCKWNVKCAAAITEDSEEDDDEDIDLNDDDLEVDPNSKFITKSKCMSSPSRVLQDCWLSADDEEDMLEHYLAKKSDSSTHSSGRAD
ncbi:hypothetical protein AgCh_020878 [Apium graveolens]